MDNERNLKKETRDTMSGDCNIPEPIWVRYSSLQTYPINKRLLEYNAYIVFIGTPILWIVSIFV